MKDRVKAQPGAVPRLCDGIRSHGRLLLEALFPELSPSWDLSIILDPELRLFYQEERG